MSAPPLPAGLLNAVPKDQVARAEWWFQHILEVITAKPAMQPANGPLDLSQ